MKRYSLRHYRKREMIEDAIIVLMPPILMFIGVLWLFKGDWIHTHVAQVFMSYIESFFSLFTNTG